MRHLKKFIELLKEFWNVWGSVAISTLWAWWKGFNIKKMDETTSFLTMTLMFVGVLTFLKSIIKNKKENKMQKINEQKGIDEMLFESQKNFRSINMALHPTQSGEHLGKLVITTMKGGKKRMKKIKSFFKWIKLYWQQIVGFLGIFTYVAFLVYAYINDKFGFILQWFPDTPGWNIGVKIGVGVIAIILVIFMIRNNVVWRGVGSIKTAETFLENLSTSISSQLSPEAKSVIKKTLKTIKKEVSNISTQIAQYEKTISESENKIKSLKELINMGISVVENQSEVNSIILKVRETTSLLTTAKTLLEQKNKEIESYEKAL